MKTPKSKSALIVGILFAVLFNAIMGATIFSMLGASPLAGMLTMNAIGLIPAIIKIANPAFLNHTAVGQLHAGLAREIYLAELMQQYRPDGSFLQHARDLSAYVQNDAINLAEAGADPGIIEDYDHVDPLPIANDEDTPKIISLKSFSTERTKITESQQETRAYAIMQDRTSRHSNTLNMNILKYSAYAFAPGANGDYTPIVRTSGDTLAGFKKAKLEDIIQLETEMNKLDVDGNRILVLNPTDAGDLKAQNVNLFKDYIPGSGKSFNLFSFLCYVSTATPRYTTDGAPVIKQWNAANESGDLTASFAFIDKEVARAQGTIKVFKDLDTAAYQASFLSARSRFIAMKMRGKYVGALVRKAA